MSATESFVLFLFYKKVQLLDRKQCNYTELKMGKTGTGPSKQEERPHFIWSTILVVKLCCIPGRWHTLYIIKLRLQKSIRSLPPYSVSNTHRRQTSKETRHTNSHGTLQRDQGSSSTVKYNNQRRRKLNPFKSVSEMDRQLQKGKLPWKGETENTIWHKGPL